MTGQHYDEISKLVSDISWRKQTIDRTKEFLKGLENNQTPEGFQQFRFYNLTVSGDTLNYQIPAEHIPVEFLIKMLEQTIEKVSKELLELEKRFHSIKVSM